MHRTKRTHYFLMISIAILSITLFYFLPWLLLFSVVWLLGHLYIGYRRQGEQKQKHPLSSPFVSSIQTDHTPFPRKGK